MQQLCQTTALTHEGDGYNDGKDRGKRQISPQQSKTRTGLLMKYHSLALHADKYEMEITKSRTIAMNKTTYEES